MTTVKSRPTSPTPSEYEHNPLRRLGQLSVTLRRHRPQVTADLGIGFVQNFAGEGLTEVDDMPNIGDRYLQTATGSATDAQGSQPDDGNGDGDA